jgi:predicted transcriptional regulator
MLERLFVSKTRIKLLEEFLLNPHGEFHIRELARRVDDIPINTQKELRNLHLAGLLTYRKKRKYDSLQTQ